MIRRFYLHVRRCYRRRRWRECPTFLLFNQPKQVITLRSHVKDTVNGGRPTQAAGMQLLVQDSGGATHLMGIAEANDRKEFLRAWYALGGAVAILDDGTPIDPDDLL